MKKGNKDDPKGLISEAYKIEGITLSACRSIFLDWVLGVPMEQDIQVVVKRVLIHYETLAPDHHMTATLRDALKTLGSPRRRGGWRSRPNTRRKIVL